MQRRSSVSVIESFLQTPYAYKFFQAARLLERWKVAEGESNSLEKRLQYCRFINSPSLSFPASEIASATAYGKDGKPLPPEELSEAIQQHQISKLEIMPTFMGLLGAQGALPLHYSEHLATFEVQKRSPDAKAFFDLFSHRAVFLFYSAWKKYRLALLHETDPDKHYLSLLLSLAGLGHLSLRRRLIQGEGSVYDETIARYTTAARQRPLSAAFLQQVLTDYFGVPFKVEQFVGHWYNLPPHCRTVLGKEGAILGRSAYAGERVWQRNMRLRLRIGPLRAGLFEDFLPKGQRAAALEKMLLLFGGACLEYEIRLICAKEDIHGCTLDPSRGSRLGWDSFLSTKPMDRDRDDASYELLTVVH